MFKNHLWSGLAWLGSAKASVGRVWTLVRSARLGRTGRLNKRQPFRVLAQGTRRRWLGSTAMESARNGDPVDAAVTARVAGRWVGGAWKILQQWVFEQLVCVDGGTCRTLATMVAGHWSWWRRMESATTDWRHSWWPSHRKKEREWERERYGIWEGERRVWRRRWQGWQRSRALGSGPVHLGMVGDEEGGGDSLGSCMGEKQRNGVVLSGRVSFGYLGLAILISILIISNFPNNPSNSTPMLIL